MNTLKAAACIAALPFLTMAPRAAHANVIQAFDLSGFLTIASGPNPPPLNSGGVFGRVTIDTTVGVITSINGVEFGVPSSSVQDPGVVTQGCNAAAHSCYLRMVLASSIYNTYIFDTASFVNYTDSPLGSLTDPAPGITNFNSPRAPQIFLISGMASLIPSDPVSVPEPASGGLLAIVAAAAVALTTCRRRGSGTRQSVAG